MTRQRLLVHQLAVGYPGRRGRDKTILTGIDAVLLAGELTCLVGPNGAGKSTLLRSVAGLQPPLRGEVTLDGQPMRSLNRREVAAALAVVLTDRFDPGRLRVAEVVAMGRYPRTSWTGRLTDSDRAAIARCLALVGAADLAAEEFSQLSDGQRQRVMVARALAQEPRVLLLDEPTAFLDPPGRLSLMMLLHQVAIGQDVAVLVCTHDIELASRYADRLWIADPGGSLITGSPEDLAYSGLLAASFATEGVEFDLASLAFVAERPDAPLATVHGQGPEARLAGHALRRAGYRTTPTPSPGALAVHATPGRWRVIAHGRTTSHDTLSGLANHALELRRAPNPARPAPPAHTGQD